MALYSLRLRRTLTTLSSLTNHHHHHLTTLTTTPIKTLISPSSQPSKPLPFQSRSFKSSSLSLSSFRRSSPSNNNSSYGGQDEKLDPDAILFEGCDYNHWLITMDFPKPPNKPTPQQMVDTYVETCAKGLNISVEEAKKKIYACSTTTYEGFQAVMTEEESEKFQGLPGVVFILPDSYIDPANKEYGGDKYMNGVIIPRPPPVQYGRQRERNFTRRGEEPRFDPQRRQGNPPYNQQGPMQGDGRNYGAPQNIPPQQNGPDGQGERRGPMPMNNTGYAPGGTSSPQGERREPMPPYQGNYNQADQRNYTPREQRDFRGDNRNYGPPQGGNYGQAVGGPYGQGAGGQGQGAGGDFGQGVRGSYGQGVGGSYGQGVGGSYGQGVGGSYGQGVGGSYGQGAGSGGSYGQGAQSQGVGGSYGQGAQSQGVGGSYGQGAQSQGVGGSYGQGAQSQGVGGSYGQGAQSQGVGGSYGQGTGSQGVGGSYGQGTGSQGVGGAYGPGGGQRPSQVDEGNYTTRGQSVTEQGRY